MRRRGRVVSRHASIACYVTIYAQRHKACARAPRFLIVITVVISLRHCFLDFVVKTLNMFAAAYLNEATLVNIS